MDYVQSAFYQATGWNRDNSYAALNSTSDGENSGQPIAQSLLLTVVPASSLELPDPTRSAPHSLCAREPELCNIVPAGFRRHCRWLNLVPLLIGPAPGPLDTAVRDRAPASAPTLIPTAYRAPSTNRPRPPDPTGQTRTVAPLWPAILAPVHAGSDGGQTGITCLATPAELGISPAS